MKNQIPSLRRIPDEDLKYAPMFAEWNSRSLPLPNQHVAYVPPPKGWSGASSLAGCVRKQGYKLTGVEGTPMDEEGLHATGMGTLIHLAVQAVCLDRGDRYGVETRWELPEHKMCSHADIYDREGGGEVGDIKSAGSFAFKMRRREGPNLGNILQATAGAMALGAAQCRLIYIATTKLAGRDIPKDLNPGDRGTFWHEWVWDTEEARHLVEEELEILGKVRDSISRNTLPPRSIPSEMPKGARIDNVGVVGDKSARGAWALYIKNAEGNPQLFESGSVWQCSYCDHQTVCAADLKAEQEIILQPKKQVTPSQQTEPLTDVEVEVLIDADELRSMQETLDGIHTIEDSEAN